MAIVVCLGTKVDLFGTFMSSKLLCMLYDWTHEPGIIPFEMDPTSITEYFGLAMIRIRMLKITITKAHMKHLEDCKVALRKSKLGQEYFPSEEKARSAITEGITKEEIFVAVDETGECLGFIWFILAGAFHSFPYLHIIAVKEEFRGLGIGKKLLAFLAETVFTDYSKVFLVVADFNPEAKRLYENLGYQQVGAIPGLYKEGVTEYLMMKERDFTGGENGLDIHSDA